jgi:hypothetical protein
MYQKRFMLLLTINERPKPVPYHSVVREDGINHGFINVKGQPEAAAAIAEVQDDEASRDALVRINARQTAFFTIGCEKSFNQDGATFWTRGFLEFAFNYCALVEDAGNYFPVFFHFNERLKKLMFPHRVHFEWQLEGNRFTDAECNGYSVVAWITTENFATDEESRSAWRDSVRFLADHLTDWRLSEGLPQEIY